MKIFFIKIIKFFVNIILKMEFLFQYIYFFTLFFLKTLIFNKKIVVFSSKHIGWNTKLKQRNHHLAEILSEKGFSVYYAIDSNLQIDNKVKIFKKQGKLILINFDVHLIHLTFMRILLFSKKLFPNKIIVYQLIGTDFRNAYSSLKMFNKAGLIIWYDYIDEIDNAIISDIPDFVTDRHLSLCKNKSFLVVTSSKSLYKNVLELRGSSDNILLLPNGVTIEDWEGEVPPAKEIFYYVKNSIPIVGYYGTLAKWIDFDLIKFIAINNSNVQFVLIGDQIDRALEDSGIRKIKNINIIKAIDYFKLKNYSHFFSVAMIPFKINKLTKSVSPVKLFEYFAQGIPVISTDIPECRGFNSCFIVFTKEEFNQKMKDLIKVNIKNDKLKNDAKFEALKHTWLSCVNKLINKFYETEK